MIIEDLLAGWEQLVFSEAPDVNPLTDEDALQEAQLLDVRFDAVRSSVGLLFELRNALQIRTANTGVLVAQEVTRLSWSARPRPTVRTAWSIIDSSPKHEDQVFDLRLTMFPSAQLELAARNASFYIGDVQGIGDAPPDYGDKEDVIRVGLPGWSSTLSAVRAISTPRPAVGGFLTDS